MSCADEAHSHDHNHDGHGGHEGHEGHSHDHDVPLDSAPLDSLFSQIDLPNVSALNAAGGGSTGQKIIKAWDMKEDETIWLESDVDAELILKIPFTSSVSLRAITVKAGPGGFAPSTMHIFRDTPELDFSDAADAHPTQSFDVVDVREGVEYPVKAAKFAGMTHLTLFFPDTGEGEETTRIYYVGLRGTHQALPNRPGVIIYESAARPTDHKIKDGVSSASAWGSGY